MQLPFIPGPGYSAIMRAILTASFLLLVAAPGPAEAQKSLTSPALPAFSFADLADLALAAGNVAEVKIRKARKLSGALAQGVAPGVQRYLVEAQMLSLIRGSGDLPPRISYLLELGPAERARLPKWGKTSWLVMGDLVPGRPGMLRLAAPDAQIPSGPDNAARVRKLLAEANDPAAPPAVTGVGEAFVTPGTIQGESETQIFLRSSDGRPVSLSVWRQPGLKPKWALSLGEIVDEGAPAPQRDTLAWYRLACFLPPQLPAPSTEQLGEAEAGIAREDYALIRAALGDCARSRAVTPPAP